MSDLAHPLAAFGLGIALGTSPWCSAPAHTG